MKAIVTGAASGIGRAAARRLAVDGRARGETVAILLVDIDSEALEQVAAELRAGGTEAHALTADVSSSGTGEVVATKARELLGGLDVLVSNAGVATQAMLDELPVEEYERTFAVNTRATWLLAKALHPLLRDSRGALVATASVAAEQPTAPMGAYSASKAALVMLVRQLAYEWGPDGIRCNCVSPGMVHTGMTDRSYSDPELRAERASRVPLRRIGEPEDVAGAIAFLAGPDAAYVSGVNLAVDGGVQTSLMPAIRGLVGT